MAAGGVKATFTACLYRRPEITDNVRGFIKSLASSLRLGTTGRFFEGGHPLDFGELLDRNVVLEIEDVGDDQDKAWP